LVSAVFVAADNFCHYIIAAIYVKVSFETRMLLNKDTYLKSADELESVNKFRCCFTFANIAISIVILLISITMYLAFVLDSKKLIAATLDSTFVFQLVCMLAWTLTLINLYRDINHSEKLLPNKRVFLLHGCLLTCSLLLSASSFIIFLVEKIEDSQNEYVILEDIR
jgi:hypothetical protein